MSTQKPLKVVHVISSLKLGGAEQWLIDMVDTLRQHNIQQSVVYFHSGSHVDTLKKMGVECIKVNGMLLMYDLWFFVRFWRILNRLKPDIIHSSLWAANFFSRIVGWLIKIPVINTYHSAIDHESVVRRIIDSTSGKFVSTAVFVADTIEGKMDDRFVKSLPQATHVIKNGINISLFEQRIEQQSLARSELGIANDAFIIGSVGRFVDVKNFAFLLEVAAELTIHNENIHVLLIGAGPLEHELRRYAHTLGISDNVTFVIAQPAYRYYSMMNCFVQPSLQEGLSLALLEAMCIGLPCVVSTDSAGHSIIQDGKNGLTVQGFNVQSYSSSIELLMHTNEYCQKLGYAAKKIVKRHHCATHMVAQYAELYQKVSQEKPK